MPRKTHVPPYKREDGTPVKGYTKEIRGPARKSRFTGKSIFFPAKRKKYEDIVEIDSVYSARESTDILLQEFKTAKTRAKKRYVKKAAVLAANRAGVMASNRRLAPATRKEKAQIEQIYRSAVDKMILD